MNYIIVDLEATCWETASKFQRNEIIEIGAVLLEGVSLRSISEFQQFIHPKDNPELSQFCMTLTSIRQKDVDSAPFFPEAFNLFINWIGKTPFKLCSWGKFDFDLFNYECQRSGISWPPNFVSHVNLKEPFSRAHRTKKSIGLKDAMKLMKLQFIGTKHRGIDDARNITRVARHVIALDNTRKHLQKDMDKDDK